MLHFLPSTLKGVLAAFFFGLNTFFWCGLLYPFAILKAIVPVRGFRALCTRAMVAIAENWIACNCWEMDFFHKTSLDVSGHSDLQQSASYLVCANHQSWVDIVILQRLFNRRIPFLRFFLKRELIFVPLLGLAWWALDFPFMRRYSRAYLEKHPEKRGEDLKTTQKACEKLRGTSISILNFLEGTRFTSAKHAAQNSPHRHLLRPKAGGMAFVLEAMGSQFRSLLDVTIYYPDCSTTHNRNGDRSDDLTGDPKPNVSLWSLFSGKIARVVVQIEEIPIPIELLQGSYLGDPAFFTTMQSWVADLWGP